MKRMDLPAFIGVDRRPLVFFGRPLTKITVAMDPDTGYSIATPRSKRHLSETLIFGELEKSTNKISAK
jgi:hypothetical protein